MKIAVFSDVHGNFEALNTVIDMIKKEQVDRTIFIGDIFQRGNQEIECLEYLFISCRYIMRRQSMGIKYCFLIFCFMI